MIVISTGEQASVESIDEQCRRGETDVTIGNVVGTTQSIHGRLSDLGRKLIVAKKTRAEDTNGRDGGVVLHLVRFGTTTAETSSHDARAVHIKTVRSANNPFDSFIHPFSSGRAAVTARCARRDGDETVRGDLSQEVLS